MLRIIDLNRNEELSAATMGKIAGGAPPCNDMSDSVTAILVTAGDIFSAMGCTEAAKYSYMSAGYYGGQPCSPS